jgi:hypothetical protein
METASETVLEAELEMAGLSNADASQMHCTAVA